jgi:hypothetical protein
VSEHHTQSDLLTFIFSTNLWVYTGHSNEQEQQFMSPSIWIILAITIVAIFCLILAIDRSDKKRRQDDRDAVKAEDIGKNPGLMDKSQQAAELQIGEDEEKKQRSRFQPDAKENKRAIQDK